MQRHDHANEVWITGIGLVSSLGEGIEAHMNVLTGQRPCVPNVDETTFAPYPIHRLVPLTLGKQIPKNSDQRQMEGWQRLGVCSAEGCDDVYVDTSRNASRRYCSNTCASRSTVAAYRARQKA